MKFDQEKQRGTKRKELGPITSCSIPPDASYQDVLAKGIEEFFPSYSLIIIWQMPKVVKFQMTSVAHLGHWGNTYMDMAIFHLKLSFIVFK